MCRRCKKVWDRFDFRGAGPDKAAWKEALKRSWDPDAQVFRCYFTGVPLVTDTWPHPRYLDREHLQPGDEAPYAAAASVINQMKGPMSETEFEEGIAQLASAYRVGRDLEGEPAILAGRLKAYLKPDQLKEFILALDDSIKGREFDQTVFRLIEPDFEVSPPSEEWLGKNAALPLRHQGGALPRGSASPQ